MKIRAVLGLICCRCSLWYLILISDDITCLPNDAAAAAQLAINSILQTVEQATLNSFLITRSINSLYLSNSQST